MSHKPNETYWVFNSRITFICKVFWTQKLHIWMDIFTYYLFKLFFFPTPVLNAWIIVFCWLGKSSKNNRNQLFPFQIEFLEIVVHVGLIWIPEGSLCGMCWDKNRRMIGYGLGKKVGLYFTTWTKCIVLIQNVKEALCGHYRMLKFTYCKMVIM